MTSTLSRSVLVLATSALTALAAVGVTAPAGAAPPERFEERLPLLFPDVDNGYVVIINSSRDAVCTDEQVQFEQDALAWEAAHGDDFEAWIEAGNDPADFVPQPPEPPAGPEGLKPVEFKQKETGQGAVVEQIRARNHAIELWRLDEGSPLVGPCLDTPTETLVATGTVDVSVHFNDVAETGTRSGTYTEKGKAKLVRPDGSKFSYSFHFHVNDRCHVPEDGPPSCLIFRNRVH